MLFHGALGGKFALPLGDQRLHHNKDAEQNSDNDLCPPCGQCSLERNECQNHALDQHTKKRARNKANTAGQQCAANDRGCDCIHFHAQPMQVVAREHDEGIRYAAQR